MQKYKNSLEAIQNTQGVVNDMKIELKELRTQKAELEENYNKMMAAPFYNTEASESAARRASKLEIEIEALRKQNDENKVKVWKFIESDVDK